VHFFYLSLLTWSAKHVFVDLESQQVPRVKVIALLIILYVYPFFGAPFVLTFLGGGRIEVVFGKTNCQNGSLICTFNL
jgi:hypothetical protein